MAEFFNRGSEKDKRQELRNSMPKAEVLLWVRLKGRQLLQCKFRRQFSIGAFVIDFYSPEIKLGIELDGDSHFGEGARQYDHERQTFIESFGIKIIRFLNVDIYENLDGVMEAIEREILDRRVARSSPGRGGTAPGSSAPPCEGGADGGEGHLGHPPLSEGGPGGVWPEPRILKTTSPADPFPPFRRGGQGG